MTNPVTLEILQAICTKTSNSVLEKYVDPINSVGKYYDMFDNVHRIAAFIAQTAHESGGYNIITENLNYSAKGLMSVFRKYFPSEDLARQYERQPEKIANYVYSNRMGNGDEASGDGWHFRGRGLIQLTGRNNYTAFATALGMSIEDTVNYMNTQDGATASAGWFWDTNKLNRYCDDRDFVGLTKRINGGTIGLEDRQNLYDIALTVLQE